MSVWFAGDVCCEGNDCGAVIAEAVTADIYERLVDDHLHQIDDGELVMLCGSCAAELSSPQLAVRLDIEDGLVEPWLRDASELSDAGLGL